MSESLRSRAGTGGPHASRTSSEPSPTMLGPTPRLPFGWSRTAAICAEVRPSAASSKAPGLQPSPTTTTRRGVDASPAGMAYKLMRKRPSPSSPATESTVNTGKRPWSEHADGVSPPFRLDVTPPLTVTIVLAERCQTVITESRYSVCKRRTAAANTKGTGRYERRCKPCREPFAAATRSEPSSAGAPSPEDMMQCIAKRFLVERVRVFVVRIAARSWHRVGGSWQCALSECGRSREVPMPNAASSYAPRKPTEGDRQSYFD